MHLDKFMNDSTLDKLNSFNPVPPLQQKQA